MMDVPEIESYSSLSHGKVGADLTSPCDAQQRAPHEGPNGHEKGKNRVTIGPRLFVQWCRTLSPYVMFLQRTCIGGGLLHQWA